MKKWWQLFLLLINFILMMGVCGCMKEDTMNRPEKMKTLALEYLNENYDDNFKPLSYSDGDWAYDYETVKFQSEKFDETVEVCIWKEDGEYVIRNDYFKLYMVEDAKIFFRGIAEKYADSVEVKVRFVSPYLPDTLAPNASFSDYVATGKCQMAVYFITNAAYESNNKEAILKNICDAKVKGFVRFVVTDDEDLLVGYSIDEMVNDKQDSILEEERYSIGSNAKVGE